MTRTLAAPVSVTVQPSSSTGPMASIISRISLMGVSRITNCAPSRAEPRFPVVLSTAPFFEASDSASRFPAVPTISVSSRSACLSPRPIEAPIVRSPTIVIRSKSHLLKLPSAQQVPVFIPEFYKGCPPIPRFEDPDWYLRIVPISDDKPNLLVSTCACSPTPPRRTKVGVRHNKKRRDASVPPSRDLAPGDLKASARRRRSHHRHRPHRRSPHPHIHSRPGNSGC